MKRPWQVATIALAILTVGVGYLGYSQYLQKKLLQTHLANRNQKAFYEMTDHVQYMEVLMAKGMVANSPRQNILLFSDLWQQANAAQEDMAVLSVNHDALARTAKFLRQTGDFAFSLAKKNARGVPVKDSDWKKLAELHTQAGVLNAELLRIHSQANAGRLSWQEIKNKTKRGLPQTAQRLSAADGFTKIDKRMQEYPTLIYDGPFSDHIKRRQPQGLTGRNVSAREAGLIAINFASSASAGRKYSVTKTANVNGTIPAYRISLTPSGGKGEAVVLDISKKGGHIVWMLNPRRVNTGTVKTGDAGKKAGQFLINHGKPDMEATYTLEQRNTAVVSFAYKQEGVLVYPDLIKVKVALDNGEIIGYEAMGYLMSHQKRVLPKPKIGEKEARQAVNPRLKINSTRLTLIPLETLQEVLCYEFKGTLNGDPFIVYINALTGDEERILKVIETGGGPKTM